MMFRVFIFIFFVILSSQGYAIAASSSGREKLSAEQLQKMLKKYQKDLFLQGDIKQDKLIKELNLHLKSEGAFEINKAGATDLTIDWDIKKPERLHVCIEGSNIYIKDSNQKEPIQQNLKSMEDQKQSSLSTLKSLMEMNTDQLLKDFSIYKLGEQLILENPKLTVQLSLSTEALIKKVKFIEASGDELQIDFLNIKQLKKASTTKKCLDRLSAK